MQCIGDECQRPAAAAPTPAPISRNAPRFARSVAVAAICASCGYAAALRLAPSQAPEHQALAPPMVMVAPLPE